MTRATLLVGTALQAGTLLLFTMPAAAQPAPNARPTGGVVVAGAASVSQTTNNTLITQSSQRAAVNWQRFDVGSQQSVTFDQPSSTATTLNRVIGPDPSQIAGRIQANGQVVLVNQSGVIFYQGTQVNAAALVVSAAGITDRNFMAGKMAFDQAAKPNAAVVNQGSITVQQAGLAALVAPQVANSGVITAKLGHVVLAGARTTTLDLYGDGLVAIDVGGAVTQAPLGPDGKPVTALVTNSGIISAEGGTVQLSARAVDGIVQNLVSAGGTITANGAGRVMMGGVGGSVVITGQVAAAGGQIEANASNAVTLAPTARVSTSGRTGGGTVAIGTTLARAAGGPGTASALTAKTVVVAQGARVSANAMRKGTGGRVAVLSSGSTEMSGSISVRGGPQGGSGGFVEVSGNTLSMTTSPDVSAPQGSPGTLLLDPNFLDVDAIAGGAGSEGTNFTANGGTVLAGDGLTGTPDTISNTLISSFTGNVLLQANDTLTVRSNIALTQAPGLNLVLEAGGTVTVSAGVTASGNVIVATGGAGPSSPPAALPNPLISVQGGLSSSGGSVTLLSGPGGSVSISGKGSVTVSPAERVSVQTDALTITGAGKINGGLLELAPATVGSTAVLGTAGGLLDSLAKIGPTTVRIGAVTLPGGATTTTTAGAITIGGSFGNAATSLELDATGAVTQTAGAVLTAATLSGNAGSFALPNAGNAIAAAGNLTASSGDLTLVDGTGLTVVAPLDGSNVFVEVALAGGTLALGTVSFPASVNAVNGRASLVADNMTALPGDSIFATGVVEVAPFSAIPVNVLGAGGLTIDATLLSGIVAGELLIGGFTDVPAGATTPAASASAIAIDGAFDLSKISGTLALLSNGVITEPSGPITVGTLLGSGTDIGLGNAGNSINSIGNLAASTGNLVLVDAAPLTVAGTAGAAGQLYLANSAAGGITVAAGGAAGGTLTSLQANALTVAAGGTITGGEIEFSPDTAGGTMNIGAAGGTALASLAGFGPGNVRLGAVTLPGAAGPTVTAGAIIAIGPFDATTHSLELDATGAVTATAAPLVNVATLSGGGTNINLTNVGNSIGGIGNLTASPGTLDLVDTVPLTVTGTASAGGQLYLASSAAGGITIAAGGAVAGTLTSLQADTFSIAGTLAGSEIELAPDTTGATMIVGAAVGSALSSLSGIGPVNVRLGAVTLPGGAAPTTTAGAITIGGSFGNAATALELDATGAVGQAAGAVLTAATLTGTAGSIALPNAGNAITTAGSLTASGGDLVLVDGSDLTVTGPLFGSNVFVEVARAGGTLALGEVSFPTSVSSATGRVSLVADTMTAPPGNTISTTGTVEVAPFSAIPVNMLGAGGLTIDATLLSGIVAGELLIGGFTDVPAGATAPAASASAVAIDGALDLSTITGTLALLSNGVITEPGGPITVGTLLGSGTDIGLGNAANSINSIGNLAASTGNLVLVDAAPLTVAGAASAAGQLYLGISAAGGITIAAGGAAGGALNSLQANALTVAAGGIITGGEIEFSPDTAGGTMNIGAAGGTALASLAGFGPGNVRLGAVTLPGAAGPTVTAGAIIAIGPFDATTHSLELDATGAVTATAAPLVNVATLSGGGTNINLTNVGNSIGGIGNLTASPGTLDLVDTVPLTVTGTASAGGQLYLASSAAGGITIAAGGAVAGTLTSLQADTFSIAGTLAGSEIELAPDTTGATMIVGAAVGSALSSLSGIGPVNVRLGAVTLPGGAAPTTTAGAITIGGSFGNAATALELDATGAVGQAAGAVLTAATLTGTAGSIALPNAGNAIATVGSLTASGGDIVLVDGIDLTLVGSLFGSNVFVEVARAGGTLALGGVSLPASVGSGSGRVSLVADTMPAQPGLSIFTSGSVEIAPFSAIPVNVLGVGGLALDATLVSSLDTPALLIGGFTNVPAGATTPAASASAVAIDGAIVIGTLELLANGAITEPGGPLTVGTLFGSGTDIGLANVGNTINSIGNLAASTGNLVLVDAVPLTVAGAASAAGQLYLSSPGISVAAGGAIGGNLTSLQTNALGIAAGGTITGTEMEFALDTAGSTMNIGVAPATALASLAGFGPGNVRLGAVTQPGSASPTVVAGAITAIGTFDATSHALELDATGAITATAAPLVNVASLSGGGGAWALTNANNGIAALGNIAAADFALNDAVGVTVAGALNGGSTVTITDAGALTVAGTGTITATAISLSGRGITGSGAIAGAPGGTVDLIATSGAISQTGTLTAGTLTGSATGAASFTGPNQIATLGNFTATTFTLNDGIALSAPGTIMAPAIDITAPALTIPGNLAAGAGTVDLVATTGGLSVPGTMTAGHLTGSAAGAATFSNSANAIGELDNFTAAGLTLADTGPLLVAGTVNGGAAVSLTSAAGIAITGRLSDGGAGTTTLSASSGAISGTGTLVSGTLNANGATIGLTGPGNVVATLGTVTASSVVLDDAANLTIAGPLTAPNITLRAPASQVTLAGGATIDTGGIAHATGAPVPAQEPVNGGPGAYIQAAGFTQLGDSTVTGAGPSTLQIKVTGNIQFNAAGSLHADNTWLILNLGGGSATGSVAVGTLNIAYIAPPVGSADLTGTIQGIAGKAAAAAGFIQPALNVNYQFNGCEIGAATCVPPLPVTTLPLPPPPYLPFGGYTWYLPDALPPLPVLQQLELLALPVLPSPPRQLTDPDVVPPNISNLDY